ncbi:MAG: DNA topoisomerase III [Thiotrichaceae bacterium]|nr:DNA topoisomerase III [Thiotrichaceae bacterium]
MQLYLCEKPSQARDISRVLGVRQKGEGCLKSNDKVVTWCFGHLLEMAPPDAYDTALKRWSFETLPIVPQDWKLEVKKEARKQFKIIQQLLSKASDVVIATDADREGETIAREILELCKWRGPVTRLWLSALDDSSIRKALDNVLPGSKTEPLYFAGLGRARADWLVGMNLTRAYTLIGQQSGHEGVLSVGRVQTPTLNLVVQRDLAIEQFKPTPYYDLTSEFDVTTGQFKAKWLPSKNVADSEGRCINQQTARTVAQKIEGQQGTIVKADTERKKESAPLPFDLSSLQQEASKRWGMGAKEVLDTAQALYETHKALTYPRTDCQYLPESQRPEAAQVLAAIKQSKVRYAPFVDEANTNLCSRAWNDKKITAHHAIIPTSAPTDISRMSEKERRLYDLACRRYIAQFYPAYEYDQTIIEVSVCDEQFRATGKVPRINGWRSVLGRRKTDQQDNENQTMPLVTVDKVAQVLKTTLENRQTKPPARYTEGTLIAAMKSVGKSITDARLKKILRETSGIGTEATRASIIETLLQRNFIQKQKKHILSTQTGRALVAILPDEIKAPATTALWEQGLDDIAQGRGNLNTFINGQIQWITEILRQAKQQAESPTQQFSGGDAKTQHACPDCGKALRRRKGKMVSFGVVAVIPIAKPRGLIAVENPARLNHEQPRAALLEQKAVRPQNRPVRLAPNVNLAVWCSAR